MTDRPQIGYYDDDADPYADEDPDLIREDAFKKWQRHRARCDAEHPSPRASPRAGSWRRRRGAGDLRRGSSRGVARDGRQR